MDNPFGDLIPQQAQNAAPQQNQQQNPFMDLVPNDVPRGTPAPQQNASPMSPFMSAVTGFNTGVGRLAHGVLQPITENLLGERVAQGSRDEAARREANYQAAKEANPVTAGVSEFVGNVIPTLAIPGLGAGGAALKLGKGALAGAGIGGAQYVKPGETRAENALWGAGGGVFGSGLGQVGEAGIRYGAKKYAQSAIPGLVEKATEKVKNYITPEQGAKVLQGNFNKSAGVNTGNWQKTNTLASVLDQELKAGGKTFNALPFDNRLEKFFKSTAKMEPALRAKYDQALGFAKYIKEQSPQSFTGAVALRQNLNQEAKKYFEKQNIKATDKATTDLIKRLKTSLQTSVRSNSGNVDKGALSQFRTFWRNANKSHQGLQDFYKAPTPSGVMKPMRQRREALQGNVADRAALGQYVRPSLGGTSGINQLNKLTGNDDAARAYIMRNVTEGRGKPEAALAAYEKLSVPQRKALFSKLPEGEALNAANKAKSAFGEPSHGWGGMLGHHVGSLGASGGLGFLGALAMGENWDRALLAGAGTAAAAKGGGALASKFASPASVIKAINRAHTPNKNAGRYLSPVLASMFSREDKQ